MHLKVRNINDAFRRLVSGIHSGEIPTVKRNSRNGPTIQIPEPVIITYEKPLERVLFNQARDCNHFFHVVEALWMLAGRNDVGPIAYYAPQMKEYSDDGKTLNGAYGYRWRNSLVALPVSECNHKGHFGLLYKDQLKVLIDHLKRNPESRRAVLQQWNVEDDLLKIDISKDCACNLSVMFSIRVEKAQHNWSDTVMQRKIDQEYEMSGLARQDGDIKDSNARLETIEDYRAGYGKPVKYLDMTVTNRSNDMIWGALGANAVHFSFLQEYMAACLGVEVGVYNQFSNNLHVYTESNSGWKPEEWLSDKEEDWYTWEEHTHNGPIKLFPLVKDPETFDRECVEFIDFPFVDYSEPFLRDVAKPMCLAFKSHKARDYEAALYWIDRVAADDWRIAGRNWLLKRKENYERRTQPVSSAGGDEK